MCLLPPPTIPSGRRSSLHLLSSCKTFIGNTKRGADGPVENLVICAHIHNSFVGNLVVLHADDDTLTIHVGEGIIKLSQGGHSCLGVIPTSAPWAFMCCRWDSGTWTLAFNNILVELRGSRTAQLKTVNISGVSVLDGTGHIASLVAWRGGTHPGRLINKFASERFLEPMPTGLLFYLPLDEGEGVWLKELATARALVMPEHCFVWDHAICCPCSPLKPIDHGVCIPHDQLSIAEILVSDHQVLIVLPPSCRGGDGIVAAVRRGESAVAHVYHFPGNHVNTLHFLSRDESSLYTFKQRFSTFSVTSISTMARREHALSTSGIAPTDAPKGSPVWMSNEILKRVYIEAVDLLRVPREISSLHAENLNYIVGVLNNTQNTPNRIQLLATVTVGVVHLERVVSEEGDPPSHIVASLNRSCRKVMGWFPESLTHDTASLLFRAGASRSLSLLEKVDVIVCADSVQSAQVLYDCMKKESLMHLLPFVANEDASRLLPMAEGLLRRCKQERDGTSSGRQIMHLMWWFSVISVHALRSCDCVAEISGLLELYTHHARELLLSRGWENHMQQSEVHTGFLPLLISISVMCPAAITTTLEASVLSLLESIPVETVHDPFAICFETRQACNVAAATDGMPFRICLDCRKATSVTVARKRSAGAMTIVSTNLSSVVSTRFLLNDEAPLANTSSSTLMVFGSGETSFTVTCSYNLNVGTSWVATLREAILCLLFSAAAHMTVTPKPCETCSMSLFQHGLNTETLLLHELDVPGRVGNNQLAADVLNRVGEGVTLADEVWGEMRGVATEFMRPAVGALLSLLLYAGVDRKHIKGVLKQWWLSGEWGSELQGTGKERFRHSLVSLVEWVISSVFVQSYESSLDQQCPSLSSTSSLKLSTPLLTMMSVSGGTASVRPKGNECLMLGREFLANVRAILSRKLQPRELEEMLVRKTLTALSTIRGLQTLTNLLTLKKDALTLRGVLRVLHRMCHTEYGTHMMEHYAGCGTVMEMRIRGAFHGLLEQCQAALAGSCPSDMPLQAVLNAPVHNGPLIALLLSIMSHPWDSVDCEFFCSCAGEEETGHALRFMDGLMNLPIHKVMHASVWRARRGLSSPKKPRIGKMRWNGLMGTTEHQSINCLVPNDFTVVSPNVQLSSLKDGILIEKTSLGSLVMRADEPWSMTRPETGLSGVPCVLYYEVTLISSCEKFVLGLGHCGDDEKCTVNLFYHYESNGGTHMFPCPTFSKGDTVGCGLVTTARRVYFTLNGVLVAFGPVQGGRESLYPAVHVSNRGHVVFKVNFGTSAFCYDYRQLHPGFPPEVGPTWYGVASIAEVALFNMAARLCDMPNNHKECVKLSLVRCCQLTCKYIHTLATSVLSSSVDTDADAGGRGEQVVALSAAESSLLKLIAILRKAVQAVVFRPLPERIVRAIFDVVDALMLLPLHTVQTAAIALLPDFIPHIRRAPETAACTKLVRSLLKHAKGAVNDNDRIPFAPYWHQLDPCFVSLAHRQLVCMQAEAQRSVVLGNVLPRTGEVSFSVRIFRKGALKGSSLKGGYYIGVAVANLSTLSPVSGSNNWKVTNPPIVWALHDVSPQLPHATNPSVKHNNFHRTYGSGESVRVVVNFDRREVDFYREGVFLSTLFTDISSDVDLVPFAQLYNENAYALIIPGEMSASITPSALLSAVSVDALRCMLTLTPFDTLISAGICEELNEEPLPSVTLALFNSVPDQRALQLYSRGDKSVLVTVHQLRQNRAKFTYKNWVICERVSNLRKQVCLGMNHMLNAINTNSPFLSLSGMSHCIVSLISAVRRLMDPLVTTQVLCLAESERRGKILKNESEEWTLLFHGIRFRQFLIIQRMSQGISLLESPYVREDYGFSALLSHPGFEFPPQYCSTLATVPARPTVTTAPYIAIAEPAVPQTGRFSLRFQLLRGQVGQILGGGYYIGLCVGSFHWRCRDLSVGKSEVWAMHDMDETAWRLRHLFQGTRFPIAAEPSCILVSGDVVRLEVSREDGTMHVYRKGVNQEELYLGLAYDNVPSDVDLFPFVHLYNTDAVAVLLPSEPGKHVVRATTQQPHFALYSKSIDKHCDGCMAQNIEFRLKPHMWYKCNECADYNLCKWCFRLCLHSHHSFTYMGSNILVYSGMPPTRIHVGMNVAFSAASVIYLKSSGCWISEKQMNCAAEALEDGAMAMWGIVFKKVGTFTVLVGTSDGEALSADTPTFVGIGEASDVLYRTAGALRRRCMSGAPGIVSLCSDFSVDRPLSHPCRSACGFQRGSTISIEVDVTREVAVLRRDWITLGTRSFSADLSVGTVDLVGFVLFGQKGGTVSISPEGPRAFSGVVEEKSGDLLCVACHEHRRLLKLEHCRVLLSPCLGPPSLNTIGYVFVKKALQQCRVISVEMGVVALHVMENGAVQRVPYSHFWIGERDVIAEERLLHRTAIDTQVTVNEGFVISRLLLILSALCENETLASIVLLHSHSLMDFLHRLAGTKISNDAPRKFMQDIRSAVSVTSGCSQFSQADKHMDGFVPIPRADASYLNEPKRNMLMCVLDGPQRGKTFRVLKIKSGGRFRAVNIHPPFDTVLLERKDCFPVKQCDGKPWWVLNNGLPCSAFEHTIRVTGPDLASQDMAIKGKWEGEVDVPGKRHQAISIQLDSDCTGLAHVGFPPDKTTYIVFGEFVRYSRTVRLCLYPSRMLSICAGFSFQWNKKLCSFDEAVSELEGTALSCGKNCGDLHVMDGTLEWDGQRVVGKWKPRGGGGHGTFLMNSCCIVSLVPLLTNLWHIEPLPKIFHPVVAARSLLPEAPAPHRDMATVMHRLVVLLARHLYLVFSSRLGQANESAVSVILQHHSHPLTWQMKLSSLGPAHVLRLVHSASGLVADPGTKPWDSTALVVLMLKNGLLCRELFASFENLLWDCLHAIVTATHRCGAEHRYHLIRCIVRFVSYYNEGYSGVYIQLLSTLFKWVDQCVSEYLSPLEIQQDVAAGVELVLCVHRPISAASVSNIPFAPLQCLIDIACAFRTGNSLPKSVDVAEITPKRPNAVESCCVFGEYVGGFLRVGKITSSCSCDKRGKFYYEVTLPDRLSVPFAVGWGTHGHAEVPSQHVGSDECSFAFSGSGISWQNRKEEYISGKDVSPGSVVGCLLDMDERLVAWSVDGLCGPLVAIPIECDEHGLYAFISTGACNGMRVTVCATQFHYAPDNYMDLSGQYPRVRISDNIGTPEEHSVLPYKPMSFYLQLSSYLSDTEEVPAAGSQERCDVLSLPSSSKQVVPPSNILRKYSALGGLTCDELEGHSKVIHVVESCMATARRFISLESDVADSPLLGAFLLMKRVVRRSFSKRFLVSIPRVEKNPVAQSITVRITELYSPLPRTHETTLHHTVLSQIYKQIGNLEGAQLRQFPLFKVKLYIADTEHAPQDLGGPYRQLWTFLSAEFMTHPEKCHPHTDFHRNPLCRFLTNTKRTALVPNTSATSAHDLALFKFLGKIMGHLVLAKIPIALDFSPFVWKYLVEDDLTVNDYYHHVDNAAEMNINDPEFFQGSLVKGFTPPVVENTLKYGATEAKSGNREDEYRCIAESSLVHSMDLQLCAIRDGLWSVLPKRVIRCLSWKELEYLVCGDSNLSPEMMRQSIDVQLQEPRNEMFWRIMDEFTVDQRSSFLCFASGQRRPPLVDRIRVTESAESIHHLPRAQSCSSLVAVPPYDTYGLFRSKLTIAVTHEMEMELA
ncbi:SPRY domain [Trypanosoma vivax]|nr:SPRY domain [Trypanosoma vivax]